MLKVSRRICSPLFDHLHKIEGDTNEETLSPYEEFPNLT